MLSSLILSTLFLLPQLGQAATPWTDTTPHFNNGTSHNLTIPATKPTKPSTTTTVLPTATPTPFHVQITRSGRRYQTSKRFWAFSGEDAIVTGSLEEAAPFHFEDDYLMCNDKYISLGGNAGYSMLELSDDEPKKHQKISKNKYGFLELVGAKYTIGDGKGVFCASDDGNIFVLKTKKPAFRCQTIDLRSDEPRRPFKPSNGQPQPPPAKPSPSWKPSGGQSNPAPQDPNTPWKPSPGHPQPPSNNPGSPWKPSPGHPQPPSDKPSSPSKPSNGHSNPFPHPPTDPSKPSASQPWTDSTGPKGNDGRPHDDRPTPIKHVPGVPSDDDDDEDTRPTPVTPGWQDSEPVHGGPKPDPSSDPDVPAPSSHDNDPDDTSDDETHLPGKGGYWGDA